MNNSTYDWNSSDILHQFFLDIKTPLNSILKSNQLNDDLQKDVVFSNSKQIEGLIETFLTQIKAKSINLTFYDQPKIFEIYESNQNVRSFCSKKIDLKKITKNEQDWLINFEKEIFNSIKQKDLNLYDLSYKMAISERQLYRKTTSLLNLTPNKYIRIIKLYKAKEIIDNYMDNSISQIAYSVGYNDVHYFTKLFTEQYDISPKKLLTSLK